MATIFSTRMVQLRKEIGMSQKDAAKGLEVSQALLSHYEKGIRECGLAFVLRAANFYDVSCDFLLGKSDSKSGESNELTAKELDSDNELNMFTIYRCATLIKDELLKEENDPEICEKIQWFFAVSIYRALMLAADCGYIPKDWVYGNSVADSKLLAGLLDGITASLLEADKLEIPTAVDFDKPLRVKTLVSQVETFIGEQLSQFKS